MLNRRLSSADGAGGADGCRQLTYVLEAIYRFNRIQTYAHTYMSNWGKLPLLWSKSESKSQSVRPKPLIIDMIHISDRNKNKKFNNKPGRENLDK